MLTPTLLALTDIILYVQAVSGEANAEGEEQTGATGDASSSKEKKTAEETAVDQTHYIVIPSYSAWFDYNCINAIEKRGLPEFFNGKNRSKTPEV